MKTSVCLESVILIMKYLSNSRLTGNAQELRKNMTKEERHLWYDFLKKLPVTINRQKVIGRFILDFYCSSAKVAIELDGSQHYSLDGLAKDEERDAYLSGLGITVLRYSNVEVNRNFEGVCKDILSHIMESPKAFPFGEDGTAKP